MEIRKEQNGSALTVALVGRLDTTTSQDLDAALKGALDGITDLTFDFTELEYVSSAGLRILLATQKIMTNQGKMVIKNPNDSIKEIFEITGFCDIFEIAE